MGLPLALIVARYTITPLGSAFTKILFTMLAVVVVLFLGSICTLRGYTTIPLPWKLLDQSLLRDVIPCAWRSTCSCWSR